MNFSHPKTIKATAPGKKQSSINAIGEKIWAGISTISLMVPGATTRDNIAAKNIGVIIFIFLVTYFIGCGVWLNVKYLTHISLSGEWFYYTGMFVLVTVCMEFFNLEKKVREFAIEKKLLYPNRSSMLEELVGRSKIYNVFATLAEVISFFWVICGIIFYDRTLFLTLLIASIAITATASACKTAIDARKVFLTESIVSISILLFILLKHFI